MKKRIFSVALSLALVLPCLPAPSLAAGEHPFGDVPGDHWAGEAVAYVYEHELMNGTGADRFSPQETLTRGMFVTILSRLAEGVPAGEADFSDVEAGAWYAPAVAWATQQGIVGGYPDGRFGPEDPITREEMAAVLARYLQSAKLTLPQGPETVFADADAIAGWAKESVALAGKVGLFSGDSAGNFAPRKTASRAEAAQVFANLDRLVPVDPADPASVYSAVVAQYAAALAGQWSPDTLSQQGLSNLLLDRKDQTVGYAYQDLNGDGVLELLIGQAQGADTGLLFAVYTQEDGAARELFRSQYETPEFRMRDTTYTLCAGQVIAQEVVDYFGGNAWDSLTTYNTLNRDKTLSLQEGLRESHDKNQSRFTHLADPADGLWVDISSQQAQQVKDAHPVQTPAYTLFP